MRKGAFTNKVLIILISILVVVIGTAFFVNNSIQSIIEEISEEVQPDERLIHLKGVMFNISNAENKVKSFGLTKEKAYLNDYNLSRAKVDTEMKLLKEAAANDLVFKLDINRIDTLVEKKFEVLDELLVVQSQKSVDSLMEKIRDRVVDITNGDGSAQSRAELEEELKKDRLLRRILKGDAVEASLWQINRELTELKMEESRAEIELRQKELSLIQADKEIMDEISKVVLKLEVTERIRMRAQIKKSNERGAFTGTVIALFCLISCALLVLSGYIIYSFVKRNSAYESALLSAKQETEAINRQIVYSINYASRIQNAILPDARKISSLLPDSFVLYQPKDIVAGDFYWLVQADSYLFIAAADCTGHGVPGAMVSVSCCSALNRAVDEFGLRKPSDILDKCRELVIAAFDQGEEPIYDGMDIALCRIDKVKNQIQFAGAHNSLYQINSGVLNEIRGDKQPVARYQKPTPFTNYEIDINPGDTFYLFTDGFADQFGGKRGKKFMLGNFRELITENAHLPLEDQQKGLMRAFEDWKGEVDQIDDVCVIGFRI